MWKTITALCLTMLLSSCGSLTIRKDLIGEYKSKENQTLSIDQSGFAIHSMVLEGKSVRKNLGFFMEVDKPELSFVVRGPDSSMFLGSEMKPNSDYSSLSITWQSVRKEAANFSTVYNRR